MLVLLNTYAFLSVYFAKVDIHKILKMRRKCFHIQFNYNVIPNAINPFEICTMSCRYALRERNLL